MRFKAKRIACLVVSMLMVGGLSMAAYVNTSEDINQLDGNPSPTQEESNINNYLHQDEQLNLDADDGEVRVGRFDQKINMNEYESKLIQLHNVDPRELRPIARAICGKEGGYAEVVRDTKKKQYFIEVTCPPFQMPYVVDTIKALDKEWVNATDDGTGIVRHQGVNRDVEQMDYLARFYTGGDSAGTPPTNTPSNPYGSTRVHERDNTATHVNYPVLAQVWKRIMETLDVPANEIMVSSEFVEISTNNDLKLGLDYVAWKNGPGRNLFNFLLGNRHSVQRYRGASSVFAPEPPSVESLSEDLWDILMGKSSRTQTTSRQRYANYNLWMTAAYIDFLKSKGYAKVVATPKIQTMSGETAEWSSMSPLVAFQVSGANNRQEYTSVYATYTRRVAFIDELLLLANYLGPTVGIDPDDFDEYQSIREMLNLSDYDLHNLQMAADLLAAHLRSNGEMLDEIAAAISANPGMVGLSSALTGQQILYLLDHIAEGVGGSGDMGTWDRYLNRGYAGQVGASLVVTPYVGQETTEMDVEAIIRSVTGYAPQGTPLIAERRVTSDVRVRDGETLVLSGLKRTEKIKQKAGAPFLSDIPVLGYLFGGETITDRTNDVVVTLDTTTTVGADNNYGIPDELQGIIADAKGEANNVPIPKNSFGYDQWLLGGKNYKTVAEDREAAE